MSEARRLGTKGWPSLASLPFWVSLLCLGGLAAGEGAGQGQVERAGSSRSSEFALAEGRAGRRSAVGGWASGQVTRRVLNTCKSG